MTVAAFFDVDGTLTRTNVVQPYIRFQLARRSTVGGALWLLPLLLKIPYYLWLDRRSRERFIEVFYRGYEGLSAESIRRFARASFESHLLPRLFPEAAGCLEQHRARHHRLVLVTGGLDLWVEPLAEHLRVDDTLAARLLECDGLLTGRSMEPPLIAQEKAWRVREYARANDIDLSHSHAYADSISDLPLLEIVGHPVAVRPDGALQRVATERGWQIATW